MKLTAIVQPDEAPDGTPLFVSLCTELDIASQGATQQEALANLQEAVEGVLAEASDAEIGHRLRRQPAVLVTMLEVNLPSLALAA